MPEQDTHPVRLPRAAYRNPAVPMTVRALLAIVWLAATGSAAMLEANASATLEAKLQHELMAPCCYGEPVERHDSDAARLMKAQIHELVLRGQSERQILDYYKAQFGMRILAEPEGPTWWVGTLTPVAAFAGGFLAVVWLIRRWTRHVLADRPA